MTTQTYDLISTTTLAASTSSVTFSGFPTDGTYRDLVLVLNGALSGGDVQAQLNADTGSNYSTVIMRGNGTATSQTHSGGSMQLFLGSTTSGSRLNVISQFMDYSATDKHKTALSRSGYKNSSGVDTVEATASRWANTSAVNSIKIISGGLFQIGTTMSLYGIAA